MEVRLNFTKGEIEYEIYRARGEINATVLKRDGVDITPDSVAAIDKAIEEIVGISFDLFSRIIIFAGASQPFLDLPVSTQRNHVEELFNITTLSEKALKLREKTKLLESDIKVQDALIKQQELTRDLRNKHIVEAEARILKWEEDKTQKITSTTKSLNDIKNTDFDAEQQSLELADTISEQIGLKRVAYNQLVKSLTENVARYSKWNTDTDRRLTSITQQLLSVEGVDVEAEQLLHNTVDEQTKFITKSKSDIKLLDVSQTQFVKRIAEINIELEHLSNSKCPYCSQHFNSEEKITELNKELTDKQTLLNEVNAGLTQLNSDIASASMKLLAAQSKIKHTDLSALMKVFANKQALDTEYQQLSVAVNPYLDSIQSDLASDECLISDWEQINIEEHLKGGKLAGEISTLEVELKEARKNITHKNLSSLLAVKTNVEKLTKQLSDLETSVNPHLDAYEALLVEGEVVIDYAKLDEFKTQLEHQQFLLKLLTDKNSYIRKNIVNQTIPFLNSQINLYTKEMGLPHVVRFDPDMSCTVTECGRDLDFGNLSGGEKKRVNLALSLAFRDVLHHLHAKVNLLMLDELDAGSVDSVGVSAMVRLMKRKSRDEGLGVWMTSHHPETHGRLDREIIVRKENGFSSIILPDD
jgi:DNA repair exonuclease SbcCD ATPase subunit